jgi:hypothetical protein
MATNLISTNFAGGVFEKAGTSTVVETATTTPQVGPNSLDASTYNTVGIGEYSIQVNATSFIASTYTTAGKHVIVWQEGSASYPPPMATVATITGDAIMYGTNALTSGSYDCDAGTSIGYDTANGKVLVAHATNNNHGNYMTVGTISGDSISFGSVTTIDSGSSPSAHSMRPQGMVYVGGIGGDTTNRLVLASKHNSNNDGETRVITISGTTPTAHTVADFTSAPGDFCMAYVGNSQFLIVYAVSGIALMAKVGTVAGGVTNTITWGSEVNLGCNNNTVNRLAIAYDEQNSKVLIAFVNIAANTRGRYIAGTVSGTGASAAFTFSGTPEFETAGGCTAISAEYHHGAQKILISYKSDADTKPQVIAATYSSTVGTQVDYTFGTAVYASGVTMPTSPAMTTTSYDALNKKVIVFRDGAVGYKHGLAVDLLTTTVTSDLTTGNYFTADLQGGTSRINAITVTPNAVAPKTYTFNLKVIQGSSFPKYFKWSGSDLTKFKWQRYWLPGTGWVHSPTMTTTNDAVDVYSFTTYDNGTTWYATIVGQDIK